MKDTITATTSSAGKPLSHAGKNTGLKPTLISVMQVFMISVLSVARKKPFNRPKAFHFIFPFIIAPDAIAQILGMRKMTVARLHITIAWMKVIRNIIGVMNPTFTSNAVIAIATHITVFMKSVTIILTFLSIISLHLT